MPIIDKIKEEPTEDQDLDDDDDENEDQIIYELTSEDGYKAASKDINKLWAQVLNAVSEGKKCYENFFFLKQKVMHTVESRPMKHIHSFHKTK